MKRDCKSNLYPIAGKSVDKFLFTAEDIFDSFDDNLKDGNVFKLNQKKIY